MSATIAEAGPVRWVQLPHPAGIAAESLAHAWLASQLGVAEAALAMARDPHGRPRLAPAHAGYDASWSHSGQRLLVALGTGGVDVGADLERLRPRPRALELAQRFFHPGESAWLQAQPVERRTLAFVRLWCAKEAVLKAHGRGIAFGLHRFRVGELSDGADAAMQLLEADAALGTVDRWQLREFSPAPAYRAALAWRLPAEPRTSNASEAVPPALLQ